MQELDKVKEILSKLVCEKGFELVEIKFSSSKKENILSIVVDRVEPISLEDIITLSEFISAELDKEDPFDVPYTLDISSLGAEKPIKIEKLADYVGNYVNLHLVSPAKGLNIVEGDLESITDGIVKLSYKEKTKKVTLEFPLSNVDKARLAIKF
ncbi:MAG: ribosome maturation factor RimP [Bacilli bacterium]|nr:ribosome maturation factor RimP [Bacilli bacterium]MDY6430179.1 ribosome maturation factor RimP [Bacilli bacterium]